MTPPMEELFDLVPCPVVPSPGTTLKGLKQNQPIAELPTTLRLRLAGVLALNPGWDGVIALGDDATHHWVHVSADEVVSFQSTLTPHLVTVLNGSQTADADALSETLSRPERLATHLQQATLSGTPASVTGHLIGAELAATRPYWLGQQVAVVGHAHPPYLDALRTQGAAPLWIDPNAADQAGTKALQAASTS